MPGVNDGQSASYRPPQRGLASAKQLGRQWDATLNLRGLEHGQRGSMTPAFSLMVKIDGSVADGVTNRFFYGFYQVYPSARSYDGWEELPDGLTGVASDVNTRIYNLLEVPNTETGTTGSGINVASLPPGWAIIPVKDGTPVEVNFYASPDEDGTVIGWFTAIQGADGPPCP